MKHAPSWQVRAVTRNPGSDASKALAEQGIEIAPADYDDEESLRRAFQLFLSSLMGEDCHFLTTNFVEGVDAVFAVTNWWEHLFHVKSPNEAGDIELH